MGDFRGAGESTAGSSSGQKGAVLGCPAGSLPPSPGVAQRSPQGVLFPSRLKFITSPDCEEASLPRPARPQPPAPVLSGLPARPPGSGQCSLASPCQLLLPVPPTRPMPPSGSLHAGAPPCQEQHLPRHKHSVCPVCSLPCPTPMLPLGLRIEGSECRVGPGSPAAQGVCVASSGLVLSCHMTTRPGGGTGDPEAWRATLAQRGARGREPRAALCRLLFRLLPSAGTQALGSAPG